MPANSTVRTPSASAAVRNRFHSDRSARYRCGASSQPSQFASSPPVHSDASRSHTRSIHRSRDARSRSAAICCDQGNCSSCPSKSLVVVIASSHRPGLMCTPPRRALCVKFDLRHGWQSSPTRGRFGFRVQSTGTSHTVCAGETAMETIADTRSTPSIEWAQTLKRTPCLERSPQCSRISPWQAALPNGEERCNDMRTRTWLSSPIDCQSP